jgi:hypothetical protein
MIKSQNMWQTNLEIGTVGWPVMLLEAFLVQTCTPRRPKTDRSGSAIPLLIERVKIPDESAQWAFSKV